jgi:hypothetical protein
MAIKTFKEIIQNKGYRIDSNDRQIFETGTIESFFGLSPNDAIEFIVYDGNDNQLPQINYGNVRYIPLTSENIGDYFLIAEGTLFQKYQFPKEYFIDIEKLLKEAGYTNGIFKTQITLINKRVGSDSELDKLWIAEISPSRTEIRLYPNDKGVAVKKELKERFNLLLKDGQFRDDTSKYCIELVEKVNPIEIGSVIKQKYTESWFNKFKTEYKIQDFDLFCSQIHNKFVEGCIYEFTSRVSDINDINYGKRKQVSDTISLDVNSVKIIIERILINVLNKYLLIPDVRYGSKKVQNLQSLDKFNDVLQTKKSDLVVDTKSPVTKKAIKKTLGQSEKALELEKAIIEEIKKDPTTDDVIVPDVITPIGVPGYKRYMPDDIKVSYENANYYNSFENGGGNRINNSELNLL